MAQERVYLAMHDEGTFHPNDELGAKPAQYILEAETYAIVGAALDVYHRLGHGFAEPIYQEALEIEFELRNIPFEREKWLHVNYKRATLGSACCSTSDIRDFWRRKD